MEPIKIGRLIAERRKEKNLTQSELGERLGVTNKTVSRWERGTYLPDLGLLPTLAAELGVTADELLAGERNPDRPLPPQDPEETEENRDIPQPSESVTPSKPAPRAVPFTRAEYKAYWERKWKDDHRGAMIAAYVGVVVLFVLICGMVKSTIPLCLSPLCLAILRAVFCSRMAGYVEGYLYDHGVTFADESSAGESFVDEPFVDEPFVDEQEQEGEEKD